MARKLRWHRSRNHSSGYPLGHYYLAHGGGGNTGDWIGHKGTFLEGSIPLPAIISYTRLVGPVEIDSTGTMIQTEDLHSQLSGSRTGWRTESGFAAME